MTAVERVDVGSAPAVSLHDLCVGLGFEPEEWVTVNHRRSSGGLSPRFHKVSELRGVELRSDIDVWHSVQPLREKLDRGRGRDSDVARVRCLYVDFDIKPESQFRSIEECELAVKDLEQRLSVPSTFLVYTGGGLQARWRMDGAPLIDSVEEQARWTERLLKFGWLAREAARAATGRPELTIDNVYGLARILRCPGTTNHKHPEVYPGGRPVTTVRGTGGSLTPVQLDSVLLDAGAIPLAPVPTATESGVRLSNAAAREYFDGLPRRADGAMSSQVEGKFIEVRDGLTKVWLREVTTSSAERHRYLCGQIMGLLRMGERGQEGVTTALERLKDVWLVELSRDSNGRDQTEASSEFDGFVKSAIEKVKAGPPPTKTERAGTPVGSHGSDTVTAVAEVEDDGPPSWAPVDLAGVVVTA